MVGIQSKSLPELGDRFVEVIAVEQSRTYIGTDFDVTRLQLLYKKVLELQPGNVEVSTDIGTALFYSNHFDEAIAQFRKTLGLDPNHPRTLFNLGVALLHGKNDALGAIQAWE